MAKLGVNVARLNVAQRTLGDGHATGDLHVLRPRPYRASAAETEEAIYYQVVVCSSLSESESALQTNAGAHETETAHAYVAASGPNALRLRCEVVHVDGDTILQSNREF